MKFPLWLTIVIILLIWWIIAPRRSGGVERTAEAAPVPAVDERTVEQATPPSSGNVTLARAIGYEFKVPSGILYGIWMVESGGLAGGWGGAGWYYASELISPGSRCVERYGSGVCRDRWNALVRICAQRRRGSPICDPYAVRTSYAMAMGPMQFLPGTMLAYGVDFDRDGAIDPHVLADAMATAARFLRTRYDERPPDEDAARRWRYAIERYYGSSQSSYYANVLAYWRAWCKTHPCHA